MGQIMIPALLPPSPASYIAVAEADATTTVTQREELSFGQILQSRLAQTGTGKEQEFGHHDRFHSDESGLRTVVVHPPRTAELFTIPFPAMTFPGSLDAEAALTEGLAGPDLAAPGGAAFAVSASLSDGSAAPIIGRDNPSSQGFPAHALQFRALGLLHDRGQVMAQGADDPANPDLRSAQIQSLELTDATRPLGGENLSNKVLAGAVFAADRRPVISTAVIVETQPDRGRAALQDGPGRRLGVGLQVAMLSAAHEPPNGVPSGPVHTSIMSPVALRNAGVAVSEIATQGATMTLSQNTPAVTSELALCAVSEEREISETPSMPADTSARYGPTVSLLANAEQSKAAISSAPHLLSQRGSVKLAANGPKLRSAGQPMQNAINVAVISEGTDTVTVSISAALPPGDSAGLSDRVRQLLASFGLVAAKIVVGGRLIRPNEHLQGDESWR